MTHRSSSPSLIQGIDGIVSRPPNEVNNSTLNGKNMETGKQRENELRQDFKRFRIPGKQVDIYVKQAENAGKRTNFVDGFSQWIQNPNKKDLESDEKEGGETGKPQGNGIQQKYRKYRLRKMENNYMKEENYIGKNGNLMKLANGYKILMKKDVESDGKEGGETGEPQGNKIK